MVVQAILEDITKMNMRMKMKMKMKIGESSGACDNQCMKNVEEPTRDKYPDQL